MMGLYHSPMLTRPRNIPLLAVLAVAGVLPTLADNARADSAADVPYELTEEGFEQVDPPSPATARGTLARAREALAADDARKAQEIADEFIEQHRYTAHPLLAEAYLIRGDAKYQRDRLFEALFDYEFIARVYPGSEHFFTALQREFEIARIYSLGRKRKLLGIPLLPMQDKAEELLIRIQERAPGSRLAERAGKELGDHYFREGQMLLAAEMYSIFLDNFPRSQWAEYARKRQIDANLATFKGPQFDATGLLEAESALVDYQQRLPAAAERHGSTELLGRVDESLAQKSFNAADWYERRGKPISAIYMYSRVITDHPHSATADRAMARLEELAPDKAAELAEREAAEPRPRGAASPQGPGGTVVPDGPGDDPAVEPQAPIQPLPDAREPQ